MNTKFNPIQKNKFFTFLIILSFSNFLFAQREKCGLYNSDYHEQYPKYNEDATKFVKKCLERLNLPWIKIPVYTIENVNNCYAKMAYGHEIIVLDIDWLDRLREIDNWFHIYVIGHEIGHVILGHLQKAGNPLLELEADRIGGLLLKKFNYPYSQADIIFPKEVYTNIESPSHPKTKDRIKVVNEVLINETNNIFTYLGWFKSSIKVINATEDAKIKQLNQLAQSYFQNENIEEFKKIRLIVNSLDPKSIQSLNVQDFITLHQSAIRFGYLDQNQFCEEMFRLFRKNNNIEFLLEIGPYLLELEFNLKQEIIKSINIETVDTRNFSNYQLRKFAMLLIPFSNEQNRLNRFTDDFYQNKLPNTLQDDTNHIDYLSLMTIYSNFKEHYSKSYQYNIKALKYVNNLALNNPDLYFEFQKITILNNQALIEYRIGLYENALQTLNNLCATISFPELSQYSFVNILNDVHYLRARIYLDDRQYEKSKLEIQKFTSSNDPFEEYIIGLIYFKNGDLETAKKHLTLSCNNKYNKSCEILNFYY